MATELEIPQEIFTRLQAVEASVLAEVEIATDFTIDSADDASLAGEQLSAISKLSKSLDEERLSYTRPYDQLKAAIKAEYDKPIAKLSSAGLALRHRLAVYVEEQERIRKEAERAEQARIERERREAEERLAREQARAANLKTDAARERAEDRIEAAEAKVAETSVATAVAVAPTKIKGFGLRDNWIPEYNDDSLLVLVKAAADNPKLLRYLTFETTEINRVVKALKDGADIPGVRPVNRRITTAR